MKKNSISFKGRVIHMICFEVFALVIFTPVAAIVLNKNMFAVGSLGIIISSIAMIWNFIYNYGFDIVEAKLGLDRFNRSIITRLSHALIFELGLLIATVPLVALWLNMTLWQAFVFDIIFVIFFLIYAFIYNWLFDLVYLRIIRSYQTC